MFAHTFNVMLIRLCMKFRKYWGSTSVDGQLIATRLSIGGLGTSQREKAQRRNGVGHWIRTANGIVGWDATGSMAGEPPSATPNEAYLAADADYLSMGMLE